MAVEGRDRGVSEVIGFVLVFSILVISFSIYQGILVPQQNEVAEFDHNQRAQNDILNLRDAVLRTGTTGVSQSTSITVGADYPRRTIAINFGVTGGSVETRAPAPAYDNAIHIENITALDAETADYLNNSNIDLKFRTKDIVFSPTYTRYADAPDTSISVGTVFNNFSNTNLQISDQIIVSGRTITLIAINGSLSKSKFGEGASVTVDTKPLSVATTSVTVENNKSGRPINITIPTKFDDPSIWEDANLADEKVANGGFVTDVRSERDNQITITLQEGKQYTLRMALVGVGTDTTDPEAEYVTDVETLADTVSENSSNKIVLEVRDKFNNPVDGFQVNGSIDRSSDNTNGTLSVIGESDAINGSPTKNNSVSANTSNGRVTFSYSAPDIDSGQDINLNFTIYTGAEVYEQVWVNTTVLDTGAGDDNSSGTVDQSNPAGSDSLILQSAFEVNQDKSKVNVTLKNNRNSQVTIKKFRVPFHFADGGGQKYADSATLLGTTIDVPGPLTSVNNPVSVSGNGGTVTITVDLTNSQNQVQTNGDFFILVLELDDGTKNTYFIAVEQAP